MVKMASPKGRGHPHLRGQEWRLVLAKPRILFVDDEPNVLSGLRRALRARDAVWEMHFVSRPEEAVALQRELPFDVVVTDMRMPVMSGVEMIVAMRRLADHTSYILLTGTADLSGAIDAINRAAVFRFYTKPYSPVLLMEGIETALASGKPPAASADPARELGSAALDQLAVGAIITDVRGRILYMNRKASRLCAAADGLLIGADDVCRAGNSADTARLHGLIREAIGGAEGDALALGRRAVARPLSVLVTALRLPDGEAAAALFVIDADSAAPPPAPRLERLLGLTPAEARLTNALAGGLSLEEASERCSITIGTARTYLKQIFLKTETSRQAELVKLVLLQPSIEA